MAVFEGFCFERVIPEKCGEDLFINLCVIDFFVIRAEIFQKAFIVREERSGGDSALVPYQRDPAVRL